MIRSPTSSAGLPKSEAGTLTRTQAARKAGVDLDRFDELCGKRGIASTGPSLESGPSHVNAD